MRLIAKGIFVSAASQQIVYGHRDFEYMLPNNIKATFKWVPYIKNVTDLFSNWYAALLCFSCRCISSLACIVVDLACNQRSAMIVCMQDSAGGDS